MIKYTLLIVTLFVSGLVLLYMYAYSITYYDGPKSDHFDGKRFFNPYEKDNKHSFLDLVKWKVEGKSQEWSSELFVEKYDIPPKSVDEGIRVSYVGHASLLIQVDGVNILTDPIWSKRASPISWFGPKRIIDPGIKFEDLPKIDMVLISHNHYDHMDRKTIIKLYQRDNPTFLVPLGNDTILKSFATDINVRALDWFGSAEFNSLIIHATPVIHWSSRIGVDRNKALWAGFVIETSAGNIYFSGDTAFGKGRVFDGVREQFGNMKLSLIAIGAYEPAWFMSGSHNNPEEGIKSFTRLGSEYGVAIHHGVFKLSDESNSKQVADFTQALESNQISSDNFRILKVGQFWEIE